MAKVRIDIEVVSTDGNHSLMTFENTKALLGFLARTGGVVDNTGIIHL